VKVGMVITGTRGDIQPFVALAYGLAMKGHEVTVTANADAAAFVGAAGLKFVPMDLDVRQFLSSPLGQRAIIDGTSPALLDSANEWFAADVPTITEGATAVADGADVVIAGMAMDDYAAAVCAGLGVPLMLAYVHPWEPTADFPHPLMHPDWLASHQLSDAEIQRTNLELEQVYWRGRDVAINTLRASLGLPLAHHPMFRSASEAGLTLLNGYSSVLVPRPSDWGHNSVMTGDWKLAEQTRRQLGESELSDGLADWLGAGPAPVFLGFGSMPILDPAPVVDMAVAAARRAGVRVLIGAGWTEMADIARTLPDDVELVSDIDHDWLFPRCQGVVHHGGAGTTAAGLTAGRPTFVFSLFADQPYWGSRVVQLGAGGHRRFHELGLDTLTEALVLLGREDVRGNAAALGRRLRQEDGVANAVQIITDPARAVVPR